MAPLLVIYARENRRERWSVWPRAKPIPPGTIQENHEYFFELEGIEDSSRADLFIDGCQVEALRPPDRRTARWRWLPGYHAGKVNLSIRYDGGRRIGFDLTTDPVIEKLTREDYDLMVREILEDTFALFSLSSFRTGIARGTGKSVPPIARLEFLRSRFDRIEKVVREISRNPVIIMRSKERILPYNKIRRFEAAEFTRSLRMGRVMKMPKRAGNEAAAVMHMPSKIYHKDKISGADIRENQNIKYCIGSWHAWLLLMRDRMMGLPAEEEAEGQRKVWVSRCGAMARGLRELLDLPLFRDVSDRCSPVVITSIFRNVPSYRIFFRLYKDIEAGICNVTGDFLDLPLARTFELYEIWAFLRILRASIDRYRLKNVRSDSIFRISPGGRDVVLAPGNVTVNLGNGYALAFQRNYREYWLEVGRRGSFSRPMVPDISVISGESFDKLVVLDAKYRIETGLNEAISSIHMYRDALVKADDGDATEKIVAGAYLLSPHQPRYEGTWKETGMPCRLFHPVYRGTFRFGAIMLRPGMKLSEVGDCVEMILNDIGTID